MGSRNDRTLVEWTFGEESRLAKRPVSHRAPTVGNDGGRFGRKDIAPAVLATALPFPAPTVRRSTPHACPATDAPGSLCAGRVAEWIPTLPTAHRSLPSVLAFDVGATRATYFCISQQPKEKNHPYLFVRRVLVVAGVVGDDHHGVILSQVLHGGAHFIRRS